MLVGCRADKSERVLALGTNADEPIVFAHRGGAGEVPESTVMGIAETLARYPAVGIEVDVRGSRDGHVVAVHDSTVERTTDGQGRVEALSLAELRALDAGYCTTPGQGRGTPGRGECHDADPAGFPFRGKGYRIATLEDIVAVVPRTTYLAIEVKAAGVEQKIAASLRESRDLSNTIVGSSKSEIADRLAALLPGARHFFARGEGTRFCVSTKTLGSLAPDVAANRVLAIPPAGLGMRLDTRGFIRAAQARGALVLYFTINDEDQMAELLRRGADGLITDYPARAFAVLERFRALATGRGVRDRAHALASAR